MGNNLAEKLVKSLIDSDTWTVAYLTIIRQPKNETCLRTLDNLATVGEILFLGIFNDHLYMPYTTSKLGVVISGKSRRRDLELFSSLLRTPNTLA